MIYSFDMLSFQILSVDRFQHREGVFYTEKRPFAALSYRVSGTGEFEIMNRRLLSGPGQLLFIPAGASYRVKYSVSESIVVHLMDCTYTVPEVIKCQSPALIERKFLALLDTFRTKHSVNYAKSQIYSILDAVGAGQEPFEGERALESCVCEMEARLGECTLDIPTLAKESFVSVSSLQRAFQKRFNTSPKQYLIERRLARAMELLVTGNATVKDVARACGFADEKYFSRTFCKHYGHPPSHFLKKYLA